MLYTLAQRGNFFTTWLALSVIAFALMMVMSGGLFLRYYHRPSFESWQRKSNPEFPPPALVRRSRGPAAGQRRATRMRRPRCPPRQA